MIVEHGDVVVKEKLVEEESSDKWESSLSETTTVSQIEGQSEEQRSKSRRCAYYQKCYKIIRIFLSPALLLLLSHLLVLYFVHSTDSRVSY